MYTLYTTYTMYTGVRLGGRPACLAARCRTVWGAATPLSGESGGQRLPGSILV